MVCKGLKLVWTFFAIWLGLTYCTAFGLEPKHDELVYKKIAELTTQQSKNTKELHVLKNQNEALGRTVTRQEQQIRHLETAITVQKQELETTRVDIERQKEALRTITRLNNGQKGLGKRSGTTGIAFTAFLDHDISLGDYRTIKFNQILLNEGNGFNNFTGLFTTPRSGVYIFSFSIGERNIAGCHIRLVKNGLNTIDGAVDTFNESQDLQSSNTATLRCNKGDLIWVEASGDHLEGSSDLRLSSFTGAFLYE